MRSETACGESEAASAAAWKWGDADNDTSVNLDDILCMLDAFGGFFPECTLQTVDLALCRPDGEIDLDDILAILDAFGSVPYSCPYPCS